MCIPDRVAIVATALIRVQGSCPVFSATVRANLRWDHSNSVGNGSYGTVFEGTLCSDDALLG